jgi:hypothetical protein
VKEKMKNARELGIAYDPDIDALGSDDDAKQDKNVIMRVKPLGEKEFTEIRKDDPVVIEIIEEM